MNRFWNWVKNEAEPAEPAELHLNGAIAEESWLEDDVTPAQFRAELEAHPGDVTVWINSPGGCVFAASQIYTMLRNHNGKITVKIDGIAASAASVVAMAGDETLISPTGMLMIHDPMTLAYGNKTDMEQTFTLLEEVKESILNAYVQKSHQSRETLSQLMSEETWMNAEKALELGLVDGILFADSPAPSTQTEPQPVQYSAKHTQNTLLHKLSAVAPIGIPIDQLEKRLALLKD